MPAVNRSKTRLYIRLKNEVVAGYRTELAQARGWRKHWLRWKIDLLTEIRYNSLLFSPNQ